MQTPAKPGRSWGMNCWSSYRVWRGRNDWTSQPLGNRSKGASSLDVGDAPDQVPYTSWKISSSFVIWGWHRCRILSLCWYYVFHQEKNGTKRSEHVQNSLTTLWNMPVCHCWDQRRRCHSLIRIMWIQLHTLLPVNSTERNAKKPSSFTQFFVSWSLTQLGFWFGIYSICH